jgi:hypothetical protein
MTLGLLLIMIGAQLYCVRSYHLTPKASTFLKQRINEVEGTIADASESSPRFFNTGFLTQNSARSNAAATSEITPPSWLKWAALFAGTVIFLQGAVLPK